MSAPVGTRESSLFDLLRWAERQPGSYASAVRIARSVMLAEEPQTVGYLLDNADAIMARKVDCTEGSRQSYKSRVIYCCHQFLGVARPGGHARIWRPKAVAETPVRLTRQEQTLEAMQALVRWPDLLPYLLPALGAVVQAFPPDIDLPGQPPEVRS